MRADDSQFSKHLLATQCVHGIMKHSREMHGDFYVHKKGKIAIMKKQTIKGQNLEYSM